jgi:hypothetical protein
MIPIAMGNGDSTAAVEPDAGMVGKQQQPALVGTKFNVVTYTPQGSLAVVQATRRNRSAQVHVPVRRGRTQPRARSIATSQWPAVWTGKRYDVYRPDDRTAAPGQRMPRVRSRA